ncbi:MAG: 3-methyl-2-oxobutanoate hydroxymethyltransferase [Rickettsiales bacterium]|nr:3-methyl-2-oxobutanoate hydroxymethyltransferase [Rickettsiales bacterium]
MTVKQRTIRDIQAQKGQTSLICLTAHNAPIARLLDSIVDILLVGDSLGMVNYGMKSTLGVTMEMMCAHGKAVANVAQQACVIVDMPFGSYQTSPAEAYTHAARLMKETGCAAVKLEGGAIMAETVAFLVDRGIPVLGHIGLLPQSVHQLGGYRYQGRTEAEQKQLHADAHALSAAGAFAVVLEAIQEDVAAFITREIPIPTIGIGASPACDGQVLVTEDLLGLSERPPRFAVQYANIGNVIKEAAITFSNDVKERRFPTKNHCF